MWGSVGRRDAGIALGFGLACLVEVVVRDAGRPLWLLVGLVSVAGMGLLVLRRRRPLLALTSFVLGAASTTCAQALLPDPTARTTGAFVPVVALVVLCYSLADNANIAALVIGLPQAIALVALVDLLLPSDGSMLQGLAFFALFVVGAPALAGRLVRRRRLLVIDLDRLEAAALAEHQLRVRTVRAEEVLAISEQLQRTLVGGLRELQDVSSPAVLEARARELLTMTRATVVRLTRAPTEAAVPAAPAVSVPGAESDDARTAVVVIAAGVVGTSLLLGTHASGTRYGAALVLAALVVGGVALAIRRPLAAVLVSNGAALALHLTAASLADSLAGIALMVTTVFLSTWLLPAAVAAVAAVASTSTALLLPAGDAPGLLALAALAALAGAVLRDHNRLVARVRAAHAEESVRRSTELLTRSLEERMRVARDLHDSVGHGLTVVALQAAVSRRLATSDPVASRTALAHLQETLARTLAELDGGLTTGAGIAELVEVARSLGLVVTVTGTPAQADTVLDRVVREALTNALRHAPGAEVQLSFEETAGRTLLTIRNGAARSTPGQPGSGTGLSGIAGRVHAAGGDVHWQRTTDGGFELAVTLPAGARVPA